MIVRLILPEGLPGTSEQLVGLPRGPGLQPAHDGGDGHLGQYQQMHVIGHHCPCVQLIPMSLAFSAENRLRHKAGNSPVAQPPWTGVRAVQGTIGCHESMAGRGIGAFCVCRGEGAEEAPGEKYVDLIGLKMGICDGIQASNGGQAAPPAPPISVSQHASDSHENAVTLEIRRSAASLIRTRAPAPLAAPSTSRLSIAPAPGRRTRHPLLLPRPG